MGNLCPGQPKKETDKPDPRVGRPLPDVPSKNTVITVVRALYNFEAINEDDLAFQKGDLMEIEESTPETDDWWLATHVKTRQKGYIPSNYVTKDDPTTQTPDWWFEFDRKEADKMLLLAGNPQGTFLVRESTDTSSYALSVRDADGVNNDPCVKHYKVRKLDNGAGFYIKAQKTFKTLSEVIDFHKGDSAGLCCQLTQACPRIRPVVAFRELEIRRDLVKLSTKLGAGCFGEVWKGTFRKVVEVAVKTLKTDGPIMSSEDFLDEAKIMHKLTHPKLVQLMAVVSTQEPFWIITELMVNGSLLDFLRSEQGKKLTYTKLIDINCQIAEGMKYLESLNFVHRDLRAANNLVGEHMEIKVADFGLARILEEEIYRPQNLTKFPVKWTAPEAALFRKFSVKSDVWSFGVLMYEVVTFGEKPYPGQTNKEVLAMLDNGQRMNKPNNGPIAVPDSYYDIMLKCWNKVPEDRPTFESLHHFFDAYLINIEPKYEKKEEIVKV